MSTLDDGAVGQRRWAFRLVAAGFVLAVVSALAAVFSGIGYQMGFWHFRTGFAIIRWAFFGGLAAVVLSLVGVFMPSRRSATALAMALIGIVVGGATAYVPWSWKQTVEALPFIHDITTDLENPPAFVAVARIRGEGDHPVAYDGPEVAEQQRKGYPDLAPYVSSADPGKVFEQAKAVIAVMGMELVEENAAEGRIEATQTSLLYGFKDDMVVRISTNSDGTVVDVRSKSRVGRSDIGQNAKRIRTFLTRLKDALGDRG
jgi:uncharacterized protein (DUF1499 family)